MTSEAIKAKADRLLAEGRVDPQDVSGPIRLFEVQGDTDVYLVFVGAAVQVCYLCKASKEGARCSHVEAAVEYVLAQGAYLDELADVAKLGGATLAARDITSPARQEKVERASRFIREYQPALAARKAKVARLADDLFRRLA